MEIDHPEVIQQQGELIVYKSTTGIRSVFDCEGVIRFIDATGSV
jgi:hypothetical protein